MRRAGLGAVVSLSAINGDTLGGAPPSKSYNADQLQQALADWEAIARSASACSAAIWIGSRIASPEMFPEAEMLPHLICSRPMFIGGAKDEADQHGGARRVGGGDCRTVCAGGSG